LLFFIHLNFDQPQVDTTDDIARFADHGYPRCMFQSSDPVPRARQARKNITLLPRPVHLLIGIRTRVKPVRTGAKFLANLATNLGPLYRGRSR
jgi:hypothetical protein